MFRTGFHQKQKKHEQEKLHWYLVETIPCFVLGLEQMPEQEQLWRSRGGVLKE